MSNDRFSIMILEQDVLEYHDYKTKYNNYYKLHESALPSLGKNQLKETRDYWYTKYINKMRYLERNYRKTTIYTNYHQQLENQERGRPLRRRRHSFQNDAQPSAPTISRERPRSLTPITVPTAIPVSTNRLVRATSPISVLTMDNSITQNNSPITIPEEDCRPLT